MDSEFRIKGTFGAGADELDYDNIEDQVDAHTFPGTADERAVLASDPCVEVEERLTVMREYGAKSDKFPCIVELLNMRYHLASHFFWAGDDLSGADPADCEDSGGLDVLPSGYLLH